MRPARPLGQRPPLRERSPHERRHERRNGGGPLRRQARHGQRPVGGRWHHEGGYPPELPPRTIPAPAPRSPPPTPRRSAGQLRSASAENPHADSPARFGARALHAADRQPEAVKRLAGRPARSPAPSRMGTAQRMAPNRARRPTCPSGSLSRMRRPMTFARSPGHTNTWALPTATIARGGWRQPRKRSVLSDRVPAPRDDRAYSGKWRRRWSKRPPRRALRVARRIGRNALP